MLQRLRTIFEACVAHLGGSITANSVAEAEEVSATLESPSALAAPKFAPHSRKPHLQRRGNIGRDQRIVILASDDVGWRRFAAVSNAQGFHSHDVVQVPPLRLAEEIELDVLVAKTRARIDSSGTKPSAIVACGDARAKVLAAILREQLHVQGASLRSVLKCEHKWWSRILQAEVVPEVVPCFGTFDPWSDDPLGDIELNYPFWIKPATPSSFQENFLVFSGKEFERALQEIRYALPHNESGHEEFPWGDLPAEVQEKSNAVCLVESHATGIGLTLSGSVIRGRVNAHAFWDCHSGEGGVPRLEFPTASPDCLQRVMIDVAERIFSHIGYNNGGFSAEFCWDQSKRALRLVNLDTRVQSLHPEVCECKHWRQVEGGIDEDGDVIPLQRKNTREYLRPYA
ncbi:hypothetical protein [Marinimicrobium sp. ABcell2]|uniref:hypothetical protein n=1 Tax=Marinimicrobium sp. ABcell2 TaxID=3069751 RepID=UPI0027AFDC11|nr:hypothetical protein [Marinimicrobium sp. ABcell2]MDQ2078515.1 hypothetical protein [Marinimicrobium sp. ABcell2]